MVRRSKLRAERLTREIMNRLETAGMAELHGDDGGYERNHILIDALR